MTRPVDAVIDFLKAEQARGKTHILLDEDARTGLRELYIRARTPAAAAANPSAGAISEPAPVISAPLTVQVSGSSKEKQLASLRQQAASWVPAKALGTLRDKMVFATGNPNAQLMLIGEAPGHEEERKQEPFVGPAGEKLDKILTAMGLSREDVYISYIVKFRPMVKNQATNNRRPTAAEIASCMAFVREEIQIVQPSCIIALGETATEALLGLTEPVPSIRDRWNAFQGIPVRISYHPSYLLKTDEDQSIRRKVWEDMLAVMEKLEMPISDKQRGFFLPKP